VLAHCGFLPFVGILLLLPLIVEDIAGEEQAFNELEYHSGHWVKTRSSLRGPTKGIPFEADTLETVSMCPPYGTESHTQRGKLYRDTSGRTSFEIFTGKSDGKIREATFIDDPIMRVRSTISDSLNRVWISQYCPRELVDGVTTDEMKKIGQKLIEGVLCEGFWFDTSERKNNSETMIWHTIEAWISEDKNLVVSVEMKKEKSESTYRLLNIRWVVPDSSHFTIPPNYLVSKDDCD